MSASAPTCETCRFFNRGTNNWRCVRNPPAVLQGRDSAYTAWAEVQSHDWCGEYVPRDAVAGASVDLGRHASAELQAAGDALTEAAEHLKVIKCVACGMIDCKGFRASRAKQAAVRALHAADAVKESQVPGFPA